MIKMTPDFHLMQTRKWQIDEYKMIPYPLEQEEYKQTLAEIGELVYKSICQPAKKTLLQAPTESQPLIADGDQKKGLSEP